MALEQDVMSAMKVAMKAKDQDQLRTLRAIKSAILLFKTDGSGKELDEAAEISLLQKLVKQRQDSLEIYRKQNRTDLAAVEEAEIKHIMAFLPEQMSEGELQNQLQSIITEVGASSMKDMGKIMGIASKRFAGKADGKTISAVVKRLLA